MLNAECPTSLAGIQLTSVAGYAYSSFDQPRGFCSMTATDSPFVGLAGWQATCRTGGMTPPYNIQERTFEFSVQVVLVFRQLAARGESTRILARQLLRSATSVGANMEEADGGQTKPDFRAKVAIARKESKEAVYWLRLIAATDELLRPKVLPLLDEANQIAAIISAIKRSADTSENRGDKG